MHRGIGVLRCLPLSPSQKVTGLPTVISPLRLWRRTYPFRGTGASPITLGEGEGVRGTGDYHRFAESDYLRFYESKIWRIANILIDKITPFAFTKGDRINIFATLFAFGDESSIHKSDGSRLRRTDGEKGTHVPHTPSRGKGVQVHKGKEDAPPNLFRWCIFFTPLG